MNPIDYDALDARVIGVVLEAHGFGKLTAATPMDEIRALAEQAGEMYGRIAAAIEDAKPQAVAIAMDIDAWKQFGREQMLKATDELFQPGGDIREYLNRMAALH